MTDGLRPLPRSWPAPGRGARERTGRARLAVAIAAPWLALTACPVKETGPVPPVGCTLGFVGAPTAAIELVPFALGGDGTAREIVEGGEVALVEPPQGGRVIFAGLRARNLDPCAVELTGVLRDIGTGQVRLDRRIVNLVPHADGWAETEPLDAAALANVPVCPNQWAAVDVDGQPFELELRVKTRDGATASVVRQVRPSCAEPALEAACHCLCDADYVLGQACAGGGGAGGAGGGGATGGGGAAAGGGA